MNGGTALGRWSQGRAHVGSGHGGRRRRSLIRHGPPQSFFQVMDTNRFTDTVVHADALIASQIGTAKVEYDPAKVQRSALVEAIEDIGFDVVPASL